jgi:hypothetical protein
MRPFLKFAASFASFDLHFRNSCTSLLVMSISVLISITSPSIFCISVLVTELGSCSRVSKSFSFPHMCTIRRKTFKWTIKKRLRYSHFPTELRRFCQYVHVFDTISSLAASLAILDNDDTTSPASFPCITRSSQSPFSEER